MKSPVPSLGAICLAVCCALSSGCATGKEIRIRNVSGRDYSGVRIANQRYGDIAAGEVSDYRKVRLIFRYAAMEMTVDGRKLTGQTLNFGSGRRTYRIGIKDLEKRHLEIEIVRDGRHDSPSG